MAGKFKNDEQKHLAKINFGKSLFNWVPGVMSVKRCVLHVW